MSLLQKIAFMACSSENHFEVYFASPTIGVSFTLLIRMDSIIMEVKDSNVLISLAMANLNLNLILKLCKLKVLLLKCLLYNGNVVSLA